MANAELKVVDFDQLSPYQKRTFIAPDANLLDLGQLKEIYARLQNREIHSVADLEKWILDRSEFESALDQAASVLYIKMTCQTDDEKRAKAYQDFIENVSPVIKPLEDKLNRKFMKDHEKFPLDKDKYDLYVKNVLTGLELFREENIELETKIALLSQEYQTITGAMTVDFDGQQRTMPEMSKYLLDPDRSLRERAWRKTVERRAQDSEKLEKIFDQMLALRHKIALNAGFKNFRDYKFKSLQRFDYTPEDCKEYHSSIEKVVLPVYKEVLSHRKELMKLDMLKPWDTSVDPLGQKALKPFDQVSELIEGCQKIFNHLDDELAQEFTQMSKEGLLDLASRRGKAPGGYQSSLNESRKPFIFMNAVGVDGDVYTLLHECGHAFHSLASAHQDLVDYRHGPMEFNEVASMGMELLAGDYMSEFYSEADKKRSLSEHMEDIVFVLVWVAIVDAFQHWIYENPQHTQQERSDKWIELSDRFGTDMVDWSGLEEVRRNAWHKQLHIFEVPFYYIEYGIAQLGALQLWLNARKDFTKAISDYKSGMALGGSKSLPEIYATAGIKFDFSQQTIAPLMQAVEKELQRYR